MGGIFRTGNANLVVAHWKYLYVICERLSYTVNFFVVVINDTHYLVHG